MPFTQFFMNPRKNKSFKICRNSCNESLRIRQQYPIVGTYPAVGFEFLIPEADRYFIWRYFLESPDG